MSSSEAEALLGTSSGDGVLAVAGGSCKLTTAEIARPVCQILTAQESLEFLSLDQVETVSIIRASLSIGPLIEIFGHPTGSSTETGSWIRSIAFITRVPP